jgi:hypothetical protein
MQDTATAVRPYFTDRSRQVTFQKCPRARFWSTEFGSWGLSPAVPDLDMELGKAQHVGIGALLEGKPIEEAVNAAAMALGTALAGFYTQEIIQHYLDLSEGLLRAFAHVWLPKLQTKYAILCVEREITAQISTDIHQMARPDAVLGDRASGEIGVWSIKSTSFWDDLRELESKVDTQGLSETWAVERGEVAPKVAWVQMFVILTGDKEETPDGKIHSSPVVRGWFKETGLGPPELAHTYRWKTADGKWHTLGKWWAKFNPAESYAGGIAGWVADLAARKIQPDLSEPISGLFHLPPAHYRNPADIANWERQTFYQEDRVRVAAEVWNDPTTSDESRDRILLEFFPQHRQSCIYLRRKCAFFQLCHGTAGEAEDPLANGFKWREVNHPQEKGD